jgi:Protein of unknown function (DUF2971)
MLAPANEQPSVLYKYISFGEQPLSLLARSEVFYENPSRFNDPLDCKPRIIFDRDFFEWELEKLIPSGRIKEIRDSFDCDGGYSDPDVRDIYFSSLKHEVESQIYKCLCEFGVMCLSETPCCTLMWSHYAEHHKGMCIGYEIDYKQVGHWSDYFCKINYKGTRNLKVSDFLSWKIDDSLEKRDLIYKAFFFNKARPWKYEREWRVISKRQGTAPSPFRIAEVYFGLRCNIAVRAAIIKLFSGSGRDLKFYEILEGDDGFALSHHQVDEDETIRESVRLSHFEMFKDIVGLRPPPLS